MFIFHNLYTSYFLCLLFGSQCKNTRSTVNLEVNHLSHNVQKIIRDGMVNIKTGYQARMYLHFCFCICAPFSPHWMCLPFDSLQFYCHILLTICFNNTFDFCLVGYTYLYLCIFMQAIYVQHFKANRVIHLYMGFYAYECYVYSYLNQSFNISYRVYKFIVYCYICMPF